MKLAKLMLGVAAVAVGEEALRLLGVSDERARRMSVMFEKHDTEGLYKLYEVWGDDEEYGFRIRKNIETLERVLQDDVDAIEESDGASAEAPADKPSAGEA